MSDDDDSLEALPAPPPVPYYEDDDEPATRRQMGRNTAADLESLLHEFSEEAEPEPRGGSWRAEEDGATLDYEQLERFLDDDDGGNGGKARFSEAPRSTKGPAAARAAPSQRDAPSQRNAPSQRDAPSQRAAAPAHKAQPASRATASKFIEQMDFAEEDDEEVEVVVKPKNARPSEKAAAAKPAKKEEPLPPAGSTQGPTYPNFKGTPVQDARRPQREKAIQMETRAQPEVFLVDRPEDHLESNAYFSGTVSFNDPAAADRFLQLLSIIIDRSAVVFHAVRAYPHLAPELASQVNEVCGLLHNFPEAADAETAKQTCNEFIAQAQQQADVALDVLQRQPKAGDGWSMDDNQQLANGLKGFLSACCQLMKVSEREQAQQFMVVLKTCLDTVENILNSHKRHCGIYFEHLRGYMDDHLYPLLENRVETTPDQELKDQYVEVREEIRAAHPQFKGFMDGQWPPGAPERAKTQATYEQKKQGSMPFINSLKHLEEILKQVLNPISDFEIRFNLPRKPLEEVTQKLIRASARHDKAAVIESVKELTTTLKELPPEDPHVAKLRMSSRDLVEHSKKVMAREEPPEQMEVIAAAILDEARQMEEESISKRRSMKVTQSLVDAAAEAADRMSLIAVDPARVSQMGDQKRMSVQKGAKEPPRAVEAMRTSEVAQQQLLDVEEVRKAAARISSRASVVVQLASRRQQGKPKAREQLYEASDRVAKALQELAVLEQQSDPDLAELQRLVTELDDEQALLFGALPDASPSLKKRDPSLRESMRKSVQRGEAVQKFFEKEKGERKPNEKLVVAREKVEETLRELDELENDQTAADDELAILVDEATRHQKELLRLAKDPNNFHDLDDFLMEDY